MKIGQQVYLDIAIESRKVGRIVIGLYESLAPNACKNFLNLCQGCTIDGKVYTYKGNRFNRIADHFMVQAGDLDGNISTIYGSNVTRSMPGENLLNEIPSFSLCQGNFGGDEGNGSQFFITTVPSPKLPREYTVFGRVIHGKQVLRTIEKQKINQESVPIVSIVIESCGVWNENMGIEINGNKDSDNKDSDNSENVEVTVSESPGVDKNFNPKNLETALRVATTIKEAGDLVFKNGDKQQAISKWEKSLRYNAEFDPDEDREPQLYNKYRELKKKCYANISLASFQLSRFANATKYATFVLEMDGITSQDKAKALYRRGSAYAKMKRYDEALADLKGASTIVPEDECISSMLGYVEKALVQEKEKERAKYSKFFK